MLTIQFFEDIELYHFIMLEGGTPNNILYTRVIVDDITYNCYQLVSGVLVLNTKTLGTLHNLQRVIPLTEHLNLINISKRKGIRYSVRLNSANLEEGEYELIDIRRIRKLKQLIKNDRFRNIIKTYNKDTQQHGDCRLEFRPS